MFCALILVVMALLFALNGWKGVLVSIALMCIASAFFIDNTVKESIVCLIGGLSLGTYCFTVGFDYFLGSAQHVPNACSGQRRWLCQAIEEVLQFGGPNFVGLLWFCAATCLFLFSLRAFSHVWKRRSVL